MGVFLAPWIGGQVSIEAQPLAAGRFFFELFGGSALPISSHVLIASLFFAGFAVQLFRQQVVPMPSLRVLMPLALFFAVLGGSIFLSKFGFVSMRVWLEWCTYAVAFCTVIAVSGKGRGPVVLLWVLVSGCTLVALKGLIEYGQMRGIDPSWRIFAGWNNPNGLAAMLLIGLFPAVSLCAQGTRRLQMIAGTMAVIIGFALTLTQSKGAFLAGIGGAACWVFLIIIWKSWKNLKSGLAVALGMGALTFALILSQPKDPSNLAALGRVASPTAQYEQSAGFRRLLWESAIRQVQDMPQGLGIGTYGFHSARTGLVQQTQMTHNTYLQLAIEASPIAPVLFVVMIVLWLVESFRGARSVPAERNVVRAGVIASILAVSAHSLIDSGLYYYGVGMGFFVLLAIGLVLSGDGSGPELVPKSMRFATVLLACLIPFVLLLYFGVVEIQKARIRGLSNWAASGVDIAPYDGESWYLLSLYDPAAPPTERIKWLSKAAELAPKTRHFRALAQALLRLDKADSAKRALQKALAEDPNNLATLSLLRNIQTQQGDEQGAIATARRTVGIEELPYLKIVAIPEFVPTETFEAREFLAERASGVQDRISLLAPAFEGYIRYAKRTVPAVIQGTGGDATANFLGETLTEARAKLQRGEAIGRRLAMLYLEIGDASAAAEVEERLPSLNWPESPPDPK